MRCWIFCILLCLSAWAQTPEELLGKYQPMIEAQGGNFESSNLWVLGLRGQGDTTTLHPDTIVVIRRQPLLVLEFAGSTGVEPPGIRPCCLGLTVTPEASAEFQELVSQESLLYCLADPRVAPPALIQLPVIPAADQSILQRFNYYQRLILSRQGRLEKDSLCVLGLRGLASNGQRHPVSDNAGGYNDTFVVLSRDRQGNPSVQEFPGCTHAGDSQDPDAPLAGVAQIRPGQYRARPFGIHHSMPCWKVLTMQGSGRIPCWRDADRDGQVSHDELTAQHLATDILIHNGLSHHRPSSIGCLTLSPSVFPQFALALGPQPSFNFYLIDANQPMETSTTRYVLGKSVKGQPMVMYEIGDGPRIALYFATIHGDEPAGTELLLSLKTYFEQNPSVLQGWQVRIIPVVNLDSKRRTNAHGVDLNRNFPALWTPSMHRDDEYPGPAALSEPESRCLRIAVEGLSPGPAGRPCRIVSIHQHKGIGPGEGMLDGDGPAEVTSLVEAMLKGAPEGLTDQKIADSRGRLRIPGSFGTWVSHRSLSIPTVTFELSHLDRQSDANWQRYRPVLLQFLAAP